MRKLYVEMVKERWGRHIMRSTLREATKQEVQAAQTLFKKTGKCEHKLVYDEGGWMYDERLCGICGKFIDFI